MAVIIHECGHLFAMLICKSPPDKIKISLFEIKITNSSRQLNTTRQNIFIIFFGPLVNFICFILFYLLYLCNSEFLLPIAMANLCTGLFNMLPVMSLDGGQLMYVILCRKFSEKSAERIINITAVIILFPLTVLGFMVQNIIFRCCLCVRISLRHFYVKTTGTTDGGFLWSAKKLKNYF